MKLVIVKRELYRYRAFPCFAEAGQNPAKMQAKCSWSVIGIEYYRISDRREIRGSGIMYISEFDML